SSGSVAMSTEKATYVDSSARVKLAVPEPESNALRRYLQHRRPLVCSALGTLFEPLEPIDAALGRPSAAITHLHLPTSRVPEVHDAPKSVAGRGIPPEELGDRASDGLWLLDLEKMTRSLDRAFLDVRE